MINMQFQQLGRLAYWQGQEFRSRDLRDQSRSLEQLRWWHNRAVHAVFGVSQRLSVTIDPASHGVVNVDCGLAYDCFGRELVLPAPRAIPLPAVTDAQYLVLAYASNSAGLTWAPQNEFRASSGVPLALFQVDSGVYRTDETFHAPTARALSRPRVGAGSTVPGNTPWEKLPNDAGLMVLVDTSSAGFTATPFYLTGLNWREENTVFSTPIVTVANSSEHDFTLHLFQNPGRELLSVVSGVGLVSKVVLSALQIGFQKIGFADGQDFQTGDVLARLLPQADLALPITNVDNTKLTIEIPFPGGPLKKGDFVVLGSLPAVATITGLPTAGLEFTTIPVNTVEGFREGDLVGIGASPNYEPAILNKIDGLQLIVKSAGTFKEKDLVGKDVVNADFPVRFTVLTASAPPIKPGMMVSLIVSVKDSSGFHLNNVVASLQGTRVQESAVLVPSTFPGFLQLSSLLQLSSEMSSLKRGDVLGVARFARTAKVGQVDTGPTRIGVHMDIPAEAGFFRTGDTVADLSSTHPLTLAVVDHVTGDTVFLHTPIPGLDHGHTLGIVALNAVAVVTNPVPGRNQFSVDNADAARAGGIAARFTGWIDASSPVHIQSAGTPLVVDSLPDGLMEGDAIGFAALSPKQPQIRFDGVAPVQTRVDVHGVDENSGNVVDVGVRVNRIEGHLATLQFTGDSDFALRPELVRITESSQVDDFLAYAQSKGLYVCWLGCQMPAVEEPSCPGLIPNPCGCR
jgi:hypothetical protein